MFRDELVHDKNNDANAVSLEHIIFECHIITDPKHVLEIAFWLENARYKREGLISRWVSFHISVVTYIQSISCYISELHITHQGYSALLVNIAKASDIYIQV